MSLVMFSLAGVPPLFGFFAKLLVLKSVVDAGMLWLAIVAIAFRHRRDLLLPASSRSYFDEAERARRP